MPRHSNSPKRFSLWKLVHESVYTVTAFKVRDTNSDREVDKWIESDWLNAASMYRDADEVNAQHIQLFTSNEVEY